LLVFALGATGKLQVVPPSAPAKPVDVATLTIDAAAAKAGNPLFNSTCHLCHGFMAVSGGVAPDLRASTLALDPAAFRNVVKGGVLEARGMPRFGELSDAQVDEVYWYVRQRARVDAARLGAKPVPPTIN
jgi:quinohemoprotein ethanol dehydrogenase